MICNTTGLSEPKYLSPDSLLHNCVHSPRYKFFFCYYSEVVQKASEWLAQLPPNRRTKSQYHWAVANCETLYAKMTLEFNANGEICKKSIDQTSKWPILDEMYTNLYCTMSKHNFEEVFSGRYIVMMLRVWLRKQFNTDCITSPPTKIAFHDYLPQMMSADDYFLERNKAKGKKKKKKFNPDDSKRCLEKMEQIINRINLDILNRKFEGNILCVTTFPCYNNEEVGGHKWKERNLTIPIGAIVSVVRVFCLINEHLRYPTETSVEQSKNYQGDLIGFADFIPECISGGGFINYPKFETQSMLIQKASKWFAQNPELKFLNCSSVDIKLKSSKWKSVCLLFKSVFFYDSDFV